MHLFSAKKFSNVNTVNFTQQQIINRQIVATIGRCNHDFINIVIFVKRQQRRGHINNIIQRLIFFNSLLPTTNVIDNIEHQTPGFKVSQRFDYLCILIHTADQYTVLKNPVIRKFNK